MSQILLFNCITVQHTLRYFTRRVLPPPSPTITLYPKQTQQTTSVSLTDVRTDGEGTKKQESADEKITK